MERNAFARAREFLNYTPTAKWTALICSVASVFFFIFLIVALALFADLLVSQGRVPSYGELTGRQRAAFDADWQAMSPADRAAAVGRLSLNESALEERLAAGETDPPLSAVEQELRWRARVTALLAARVGEGAAARYTPAPDPEAGRPAEQLLARNLRWIDEPAGLGVLSPVVRHADSWAGRVLGWIASWNPWMYRAGNTDYLTGLFAFAVVMVLGRSLMLGLVNRSASNATSEAITRLRRAIYHHTYRLGTLAIRKLGPGEAVSLFTRHAESIHDALHVWLTRNFRYPVQFALLLVVALALNVWLALTFVLGALLVWFLGGQITILYRTRARHANRRAANRLALLQESITMMRLVKCHLMDLFNQSRVERQLAEYERFNRQRSRSEAGARGLLLALAGLAGVALLYVAGRVVLAGGIDVSTLVVLAVVLVSMYFPLRGMLEIRRVLRRGRESSAVLFEFLDRRGEVAQVVGAEFLPPLSRKLEFANVSLREPGTGRMLLENVNFSVEAGQKVCLIGPDEGELQALVYLIPRFLDPTGGMVRIDGKDIRWVTHDSLRSQMAVVLYRDLVFNDTVGNNIGCGDAAYGMPQIIEAAKLAHAHQFIQQLPNGYETPIGGLGHSLRTGEQYRVALARALIRDPALLIIEEPPGLDRDTQALIDDTLARVIPGRTVIFLPRRDSTIKSSDRIVIIRKGKIDAVGTHDELKQSSRLYKHLHATEFSAFAEVV